MIQIGARDIVAIEVKATSNPTKHDARHLMWLRSEFGGAMRSAVILHTGRKTVELADGVVACPIAALWS